MKAKFLKTWEIIFFRWGNSSGHHFWTLALQPPWPSSERVEIFISVKECANIGKTSSEHIFWGDGLPTNVYGHDMININIVIYNEDFFDRSFVCLTLVIIYIFQSIKSAQSFGTCVLGSCGGSLSDCSQVAKKYHHHLQLRHHQHHHHLQLCQDHYHFQLCHHQHHQQELQHCASMPVISLGFSIISILIGVIQVFILFIFSIIVGVRFRFILLTKMSFVIIILNALTDGLIDLIISNFISEPLQSATFLFYLYT